MGTPGVPFNIPRSRILECIKKKKGVVTQICSELDIDWKTYHKHIYQDPELKAALDDARNDFDDTICDMAETTLMRALNQKEDMSAALSSAKFVLNNKGKKRGYSPVPLYNESKDTEILEVLNGLKKVSANSRSEVVSESIMATEQPLSHSGQEGRLDPVSTKSSSKKGLQ